MSKAWQQFKLLVREAVGFNLILWGLKIAPQTLENDQLTLAFCTFLERTKDRYVRVS